ncbi:MAG: Uma2 family endonuclease [Myxococcota bacterium]
MVLDVPEDWLKERARLGLDRRDEMWNGVLHMVPPPSFEHQDLAGQLFGFLLVRLASRGIRVLYETGVFRPGGGGKDYRIPDMVFFRASDKHLVTDRGIEGAPLAVLEVLSPDDESYEKLDFWAALGVAEVIMISPKDRAVELYRLAGTGYVATSADASWTLHAASIDVRWSRLPRIPACLRVECGGEAMEI